MSCQKNTISRYSKWHDITPPKNAISCHDNTISQVSLLRYRGVPWYRRVPHDVALVNLPDVDVFYGNDCIKLHHTTLLQRYISLYTALPRYDEGCCCYIHVHRFFRSVKLTVCWFLQSERWVLWLFWSCDGSDQWYCSHVGKSTHRCNDGSWNRHAYVGFVYGYAKDDIQHMFQVALRKGANHCSEFSLWIVLHMLDSMWNRMKVWLVAWKPHDVCLRGNDVLINFFGRASLWKGKGTVMPFRFMTAQRKCLCKHGWRRSGPMTSSGG